MNTTYICPDKMVTHFPMMTSDIKFQQKPEKGSSAYGAVVNSFTPSLWTLKELKNHLSEGGSFRPGILMGSTANSWVGQQIFGIDIDEGISIEQAKEIAKDHDLPINILYTTFSHKEGEGEDRFRLIFLHDEPIFDDRLRRLIIQTLMMIFSVGKKTPDKHCVDAGRYFLGTQKAGIREFHDDPDDTFNIIYLLFLMKRRLEEKNRKRGSEFAKDLIRKKLDITNVVALDDSESGRVSVFCTGVFFSLLFNDHDFFGQIDPKTCHYYVPHVTMPISVNRHCYTRHMKTSFMSPIQEKSEILVKTKKVIYKIKINPNNRDARPARISKNKTQNDSEKNELIHRFDDKLPILLSGCPLLNDYSEFKNIKRPGRRIILSSLVQFKGGRKWYNEIYNNNTLYDYDTLIDDDSVSSWNPEDCSDVCPYYDSPECKKPSDKKNMLSLLPLGDKRKSNTRITIRRSDKEEEKNPRTSLSDARSELKEIIQKIINDPTPGIHLIKFPTGVGKTETVLRELTTYQRPYIYSTPTHLLKNEVYERIIQMSEFIPNSIIPQKQPDDPVNDPLFPPEKRVDIMNRRSLGLSTRRVYQEVEKSKGRLGRLISEYISFNEEDKKHHSLFLTHQKAIRQKDHALIILDEDPKDSLFHFFSLPLTKLTELMSILPKSSDLKEYISSEIKTTKEKEKNPRIKIGDKKPYTKELTEEEEDILLKNFANYPIMSFLSAKQFFLHEDELKRKTIRFNSGLAKLDDKVKYIILSATANEDLYKELYPGIQIHHGPKIDTPKITWVNIHQISKNFLKDNLQKVQQYLKFLHDEKRIDSIITFKSYTEKNNPNYLTFQGTDIPVVATFGALEGLDNINTSGIAIVGDPFIPTHILLDYQFLLNEPLDIDLKMTWQEKIFDEFLIKKYAPTSKSDFWISFARNELEQAVGRVRPDKKDVDIFLFSQIPVGDVMIDEELNRHLLTM